MRTEKSENTPLKVKLKVKFILQIQSNKF